MMDGFSTLAMSVALPFAAAAGASFELSDEQWKARCPAIVTYDEMKARGREPKLVHGPVPKYPNKMLRTLQPGLVILLARVDTIGAVIDVRVVKASSEHFVPNSVAAVRQWRYEPPSLDGKPMCVEWEIEVKFFLR